MSIEYSMGIGVLVSNMAKRNAKSEHYNGEEISKLFFIVSMTMRVLFVWNVIAE